ncbi:phosphatase PAP2 family protein [Actinomycetaceae bacterium MB13-C1-2]|nr:phosphatase PAP2 family protein [Actinomycetaceae bacterium MB13-C1-2]
MSSGTDYWPASAPRYSALDEQIRDFSHRVALRRGIIVVIAVILVALLWSLAVTTPTGQLIDTLSMQSVKARLDFGGPLSESFSSLVSETTVAIAAIIAFGTAVTRRRVPLGVRVLLMLLLANGLTQLLKAVLVRPDLGVGHSLVNSFPSGHVTVIASIAVALVAVVPLRARGPLALLGFLVTSATSIAVMALSWHRPSDVLGALAIVLLSAMVTLPTEWDPKVGGFGLAIGVAFSAFGIVLSLIGIGLVTYGLWDTAPPVSQAQIVDLAALNSPGLILAAAACLITVSFSGLLFASVRSLAGSFGR